MDCSALFVVWGTYCWRHSFNFAKQTILISVLSAISSTQDCVPVSANCFLPPRIMRKSSVTENFWKKWSLVTLYLSAKVFVSNQVPHASRSCTAFPTVLDTAQFRPVDAQEALLIAKACIWRGRLAVLWWCRLSLAFGHLCSSLTSK